jgi:hypothetical protein
MVGAHPFGGFNMSGTDSKAGGPDYLLLFTQAKSIAEKLGDLPTVTPWATSCQSLTPTSPAANPPPAPPPRPARLWWIVNNASSSRSETPVLS